MPVSPTPVEIEERLAALYANRGSSMRLRPDPSDGAELARCHDNAQAFCARNPGHTVVTGWILLPIGNDFYLFCPHSIVRDGAGVFRDVTPQRDTWRELEFVQDDSPVLRYAIEKRIGSYQYPPVPEAALLDNCMAPANDDSEILF